MFTTACIVQGFYDFAIGPLTQLLEKGVEISSKMSAKSKKALKDHNVSLPTISDSLKRKADPSDTVNKANWNRAASSSKRSGKKKVRSKPSTKRSENMTSTPSSDGVGDFNLTCAICPPTQESSGKCAWDRVQTCHNCLLVPDSCSNCNAPVHRLCNVACEQALGITPQGESVLRCPNCHEQALFIHNRLSSV